MRRRLQSGMTFLELIIAVFILVVGIASSFSLTQKAISSSRMSMGQITANYLAQEGLELVKNIRDNNIANIAQGEDVGWLEGIISDCSCCEISYDSGSLTQCQGEDPSLLKRESSSGFYSHNGDTTTNPSFSRRIVTELSDSGDYILVKSIVSWDNYNVIIAERLYLWRTSEFQ